MQIKEFKQQFTQQLSTIYPATELQSFWGLLLEHYLGITRIQAALEPETILTKSDLTKLEAAVDALKAEKPIQYILGEAFFFGYTFKVNKSVLIPRPETEELVAWVIQDYQEATREPASFKVLDIGTGSACIPISLAKNLPQLSYSAIDISADAISVAKTNAALHSVSIDFQQQDVLALSQLPQQYQYIISNPPYVRECEKASMRANVLDYEPETALYVSDEHPLVFYQKIAELALIALVPRGKLFFEINEYLAEDLIKLLQTLGFDAVEIKNDLHGKARMCKVERPK